MNFINPSDLVEIPILEFSRNLGIGLLMAVIFAWLVQKSTRLVVDTSQYLPLFLLLIPTMILIITVIKSSIALSLGLVGALSIIRFRTPIKEPEELAYIFIAVAIGLGLGANQVVATIVGFLVVAIAMLPAMFKRSNRVDNRHVYIDINLQADGDPRFSITTLIEIFDSAGLHYRVKRLNEDGARKELTLEVSKLDMVVYERVKTQIVDHYGNCEISVIDNSRVIT